MDFASLIADFSKRHNIPDLVAEDNAAALDIDGITVTLAASGDTLAITAEIGEPPAEGKAAFAELLLEANAQGDAFFAKSSDSNMYVLIRRLSLPALDTDSMNATLEAIVNQAESWRKMLTDFRPVAEKAAESNIGTPPFGIGNFVQV